MVIELSGVQYYYFKIIWTEIVRMIWNYKYDFRPKQHDTRLNYHFITSIFKITQIQDLVSSDILSM